MKSEKKNMNIKTKKTKSQRHENPFEYIYL